MGKLSKNIRIEVNHGGYSFEVDGKEIQIYESAPLMDVWLFGNIVSQITYFLENTKKHNPQAELQYETSVVCDMCDLIVRQENKTTIRIISQFYDGSDKEEAVCNAKAFYKELIRTTDAYLQTIENDENLSKLYQKSPRNAYTLEKWKTDMELLKEFVEKNQM